MKKHFPNGLHRRPKVTPAEENNKETGGEYIIEKFHTVDALTELTDTQKSTSLHLAIACFLQTPLCRKWSRTGSSGRHILVTHLGTHMNDDVLLRNSPGSSQRVRYRPMGLHMIEKNKLHINPAHDMGSDQVPTEPLITLCAESTRTQPSRVQEASDKAQSVKRALVISRPDGIGRSTASSSARARFETTTKSKQQVSDFDDKY